MKDTVWLSACEHHSMPLHLKKASGMGINGGADGRRGAIWAFDPGEDRGWALRTIGTNAEVYGDPKPIVGVLDPSTNALSDDGEYFHFARVPVWKTRPATTFRYLTNGGGGDWGDPLERDPEHVKNDVRDSYVSIIAGARDYGSWSSAIRIAIPRGSASITTRPTRSARPVTGKTPGATPRDERGR